MAAAARRIESLPIVLIIEDETAVCELITEILEGAGFDTHCVTNDRAAYSALSAVRRYAAIIVDVNLGTGTTGFDVARFARQMDPKMAVLYVSGAASEGSFKAFGVPGSAFLEKPFEAADLVARMTDLVGGADTQPSG
jgi:DNA-binding response OmpR family regulator